MANATLDEEAGAERIPVAPALGVSQNSVPQETQTTLLFWEDEERGDRLLGDLSARAAEPCF